MPGHTPEEKAKNAAARSIQPAPDRQGGSAAVSNDAGSQSTIGKWREYLKRPEVVAGLLQFSAQMLQTNPGGFGPAFGTSLAAGLGAAGRFSKLEREHGQAREGRIAASAQQGFENKLAERKQIEVEKRTQILGRPRAGGRAAAPADDKLREEWGAFVDSEFEFKEGILDPTTKTARVNAAVQASKEQVMQAALAQGVTPSQVIDDYLGGDREKLRAALGFDVAGSKTDETAKPEPEATKLTPGARTPTVTRGAGESPEDFEVRRQKREATETTRVKTLGAQDEVQRLATDTANRQDQVRNSVQEELKSGRSSEEEIAELLIQRGFTDQVSLDLLEAEFPGLWDIVKRKLTGG